MKTILFVVTGLFFMGAFGQDTITGLDSHPYDESVFMVPQHPVSAGQGVTQMPAASSMDGLEFKLSLTVLIFGFLVIILEMILIRQKKISSEDTIKFVTITLIITATLFLITAGYSNDQIAPAVGLLGTIAGYLLGKMQQQPTSES